MTRKSENIYKRKDGRWEGRYIKGRKSEGKIIYGYIYGQKYTEVKQQLFQMKILNQKYYLHPKQVLRSTDTFAAWAFNWLSEQKRIVKPNTYINYKSKLLNHLLPKIGQYILSEITEEYLQNLFDELQNDLSNASVNGVYRVLNTCLNAAVKEHLLAVNPLQNVRAARPQQQRVSAFSKAEQRKLESNAIFEKDFPVIFSLYTGLRIGELTGLRWEDIDWVNQTLFVQRNLQPQFVSEDSEAVIMQEGSLKTKSSQRIIPIGNQLFKNLKKWQKFNDSSFLFCNKKGDAIKPRTLRYRFEKLKERAGVSNLPFHALRHTFATRCIEQNVPITTISSLLGHQSVKMTLDTYTNSFLEDKRQAIDKLEDTYPVN